MRRWPASGSRITNVPFHLVLFFFFIVMERIIEQKTSEAIKKLEKQFKSTFSAYTSTIDKSRKQQAHKKLEGNDDCT